MKILKAKDGCVYVRSDLKEIYGYMIYAPDTFDEKSIVEVTQEEADKLKKEIEENANNLISH